MRRSIVPLAAALLLLPASGALARDRDKPEQMRSQAFRELVECRSIAEAAARLACFDGKVAALDQAEQAGDLVVADRETMQETRRGLFGFRLPSLGIFGGHGDNPRAAREDEIDELESTVASARQVGYGSWRITLADGAVWEQIDTAQLALSPKPGNAIVIKSGVLGSYKARVAGQPAIKVRRVE